MKAPCYYCENNGCGAYHTKCEEYVKWKKSIDELRKQKYERTQCNVALKELHTHAVMSSMKHSHRPKR